MLIMYNTDRTIIIVLQVMHSKIEVTYKKITNCESRKIFTVATYIWERIHLQVFRLQE